MCLHYNLVADACYKKLTTLKDPTNPDYFPFIIAALISFDMNRQMGSGLEDKYIVAKGKFASRLHHKICANQAVIKHLSSQSITTVSMEAEKKDIVDLYDSLALKSPTSNQGLSDSDTDFHVGATKILHFINPELFPIIDSNVAKFATEFELAKYMNTTQPGYTSSKYVLFMQGAQSAISSFSSTKFQSLEPGTPIMRIFDKIAFSA